MLKQGFNVDPLLQKQADCISTMIYNEYWQVIDAGVTAEDLVVFPYEDQGVATLEDGLYVLEAEPEGRGHGRQARALRRRPRSRAGSTRSSNPDEAADIVLENDETGAQTEKHQRRMMGEINKLVGDGEQGIGYLDPADYQRTVKVLLAGGSDPVITKAPEGAWSHEIWEGDGEVGCGDFQSDSKRGPVAPFFL